jgi:hypothetical protein
VAPRPVFIVPHKDTKSRPYRSQSVRTSEEAGQCPWSKGTQESGCDMTSTWENQPTPVPHGVRPHGAQQAGRHRAHVTWYRPMAMPISHVDGLPSKVKGLCSLTASMSESWYSHGRSPSILSEVIPLTGEPDAGNPPVRFGGRGDRNQSVLPTPILSLHFREYGLTSSSPAPRMPNTLAL